MDKKIKIILILIGVILICYGIWAYATKKDMTQHYLGVFIGIGLILTANFLPEKRKKD